MNNEAHGIIISLLNLGKKNDGKYSQNYTLLLVWFKPKT